MIPSLANNGTSLLCFSGYLGNSKKLWIYCCSRNLNCCIEVWVGKVEDWEITMDQSINNRLTTYIKEQRNIKEIYFD